MMADEAKPAKKKAAHGRRPSLLGGWQLLKSSVDRLRPLTNWPPGSWRTVAL
jgi:hypothetical protein